MTLYRSRCVWTLPSTRAAPGIARDRVRQGVSQLANHLNEILDVLLLLASEAVTNALRHGFGPILLVMTVEAGSVRLEISDASPQLPRLQGPPGGLDAGGRGLYLIDALATRWGVTPLADGSGKTVWLELTTS